MTYLSVCSGIEAASVAWEPLGMTPVGFAEIDRFPSAVLAHRFPHVTNYGDFTGITDGGFDILVGGTPCQSFSVAGLRGGLADDRGNLALEFCRLALRTRPRWVVWENVPGVLSSNGGRDFGAILGGLAECGYGFAYRILDAQYFGVPQRRRRVFVVGHLGDWRRAAAVLFERHSLCGHSPPRRQAGQCVATSLASRARAGGGLGTDFDCDGGLIPEIVGQAMSAKWSKGSSGPAGDEHHNLVVTHSLRAEGFDASEDGTGRGTPLVPVAFQCHGSNVGEMGHLRRGNGNETGGVPFVFDTTQVTSKENGCNPQPGNPCHPLAATAHPPAVAFQTRIGRNGRGQPKETVDALTSCEGGSHADSKPHVAYAGGVRRLTPRECERLQGFPDDWTLIPYRNKAVDLCSDGPRYKAIGNSMAVPVMRWIGKRLLLVDGGDA